MPGYTVEGLVLVNGGSWAVWSSGGVVPVQDYGEMGDAMLTFSADIDAQSEAEAVARFISTYFPVSDAGPELFDEVILRH